MRSHRSKLPALHLLISVAVVSIPLPANAQPAQEEISAIEGFVQALLKLGNAIVTGPSDMVGKLKVRNFLQNAGVEVSNLRDTKRAVAYQLNLSKCDQQMIEDLAKLSDDMKDNLDGIKTRAKDLRSIQWLNKSGKIIDELSNSISELQMIRSKGWVGELKDYCNYNSTKKAKIKDDVEKTTNIADSAQRQISSLIESLQIE